MITDVSCLELANLFVKKIAYSGIPGTNYGADKYTDVLGIFLPV
tara:strand:+ start:164 stop:295 length:132 start_codon:yes stop_codon:yes gene_type:complete